MIADEALADALGLLVLIVFPNMANFAVKFFENLTRLMETNMLDLKALEKEALAKNDWSRARYKDQLDAIQPEIAKSNALISPQLSRFEKLVGAPSPMFHSRRLRSALRSGLTILTTNVVHFKIS